MHSFHPKLPEKECMLNSQSQGRHHELPKWHKMG